MIEVIIFDFDGVIVESVAIKTKAFSKLFKREGSKVIKKIISYHLRNTGISRYEKFRYIYREILKRKLTDVRFKELCQKFSLLVIEQVVTAPFVAGAKEFLNNYSSKYKCFVLSATPQKEIKEIVKRKELSHFFKSIYGAPTDKSDAVKEILIKENIGLGNIVYIGDALSDYNAAKANSINFIARINNNESLFENLKCLKIRDLTGLNKIIETL